MTSRPGVHVTGSAAFRRKVMQALFKLPARYNLQATKIVERRRQPDVATADAETGIITINPVRISHNRDPDLLPSLIVHENTHLLQGPVKNWNRDIAKMEREAYAAQIKYLRKVGNRKLAQRFRDITERNISEQTRITYI